MTWALSVSVSGLIFLLLGSVFIKSQVHRTAFGSESENKKLFVMDRPDIPVAVFVIPESFSERTSHILDEFNDIFPYPLVRLTTAREEAKITILVASVYDDSLLVLRETIKDEYLRVYGERKSKEFNNLVDKYKAYTKPIPEQFPCQVFKQYDIKYRGDPRLPLGILQPGVVVINISTKKTQLDYRFDACIREEIAHAFFHGGLPDRKFRVSERSLFNKGYGYQANIDNFTWSDILAMRVLLYAIETNRRSRYEFENVIKDYFLSHIFG